MQIRGIKRGQIIELLEQINSIPDGAEVIVNVELPSTKSIGKKQQLTDEQRLIKLNQLFGVWQNQPDLGEIFDEIDQQRHSYHGRLINDLE
ncbi:hypothetical protein [Nostoc sp. FACHB-110]|uniref:hypothetical protein n=1 Tax=Nostoc sp. FACHB-110 TaxID=2692834 RepID=UPI001686CACD|nr:hypothetical protein [Nostoc sp. FACHB-110]MBD2438244.1 hypothetical protein [Nostoc sp. FACHB-110]